MVVEEVDVPPKEFPVAVVVGPPLEPGVSAAHWLPILALATTAGWFALSGATGLIESIIAYAFHGLLLILAVRIALADRRIQRLIGAETRLLARLRGARWQAYAHEIVEEMQAAGMSRPARANADGEFSEWPTADSIALQQAGLAASHADVSVFTLLTRCVAAHWARRGIRVQASLLTAQVTAHIERQLTPLSSLEAAPMALGFCGTLVGAMVQVLSMATLTAGGESPVGLSEMLAGVAIAVTTTIQGLLTAGYAHHLLSRRARIFDRLGREAIDWVEVAILPGFDPENRLEAHMASGLSDAVDKVVEHLDHVEQSIAQSQRAFGTAIDDMLKEAAVTAREVVRDDLMMAVREGVANLVGTATDAAIEQITELSREISKASVHIRESVDMLEGSMKSALDAPGRAADDLTGLNARLELLIESFVAERSSLTDTLADLRQHITDLLTAFSSSESQSRLEASRVASRELSTTLEDMARRFETAGRHVDAGVTELRRVLMDRLDRVGPVEPGEVDDHAAAGPTRVRA